MSMKPRVASVFGCPDVRRIASILAPYLNPRSPVTQAAMYLRSSKDRSDASIEAQRR